jgi:hypothetical protein
VDNSFPQVFYTQHSEIFVYPNKMRLVDLHSKLTSEYILVSSKGDVIFRLTIPMPGAQLAE